MQNLQLLHLKLGSCKIHKWIAEFPGIPALVIQSGVGLKPSVTEAL